MKQSSAARSSVETQQEAGRKSDMALAEVTKSIAMCPWGFWGERLCSWRGISQFPQGQPLAVLCLPLKAALGRPSPSI